MQYHTPAFSWPRVADMRRWHGACAGLWVLLGSVASGGCWPSSPPEEPVRPSPPAQVRLLVVDNPGLAAGAQREWRARTGGELQLEETTTAELLRRERLDTDAVIVPPALLGELVQRGWIGPAPAAVLDDTTWERGDVLPQQAGVDARWGQQDYALPLGNAPLVLLARADLLAHLDAAPPATWEEYGQLAARLADRAALGSLAPAAEEAWVGALEPLGPGWRGEMLLARGAAYIRQRSLYSTWFDAQSMRPLIAGPPFVRALEEMVVAARHGGGESHWAPDPDAAREVVLAGRAGMAIAWLRPQRAGGASSPARLLELRVAELPGAVEAYHWQHERWEPRPPGEPRQAVLGGLAGAVGVVSEETRRRLPAWRALALLGSREWSPLVTAAGSPAGPFRQSHLAGIDGWVDAALVGEAAREYAEVIRARQNEVPTLRTLAIPGRDEYLAALDQAVLPALRGEATPNAALATAAQQWEEITERRGRQHQQAAYLRSLGLDR